MMKKITRQSNIYILKEAAKIIDLNLNIIEAEDGAECIYIIYKCISRGIKISCIFSDEHMNFIKGTRCSEIIKEKSIPTIPYYLVTSFDSFYMNQQTVTQILAKPLTKDKMKYILSQYKK